jgi:prolyl oligopeptidase PreP (S9A serine peptidase family)
LEHESDERCAWLAAQQRCFETHMEALASRRYFRSRMRKYQKGESFETPFQLNNNIYFYFKKVRRDHRHYVLYCTPNVRQQGVPLLNPNVESVGERAGAELTVAGTWVSEDCRKLAYALVAGGDAGTSLVVRIRDVESRKDSIGDELVFEVDGTAGSGMSVTWVHRKHKGFFYTRWARSGRPGTGETRSHAVQEVLFHRLHSAQADDVVVFRGAHAARAHVLTVSQDDTFLVVEVFEDGLGSGAAECAGGISDRGNQLLVFDIAAFDFRDVGRIGPGLLLVDSFAHRWEYVASMGRELWLRTNLSARAFRVVRTFVSAATDAEKEAATAPAPASLSDQDVSWPPLPSVPIGKRPPVPVISRPILFKSPPSSSSSSSSSSSVSSSTSSSSMPPSLVECIPASPRGLVLERAQLAAQSVLVLKYLNLQDGCHEVQLFDLAEAITLMAQAAVAADMAQRHGADAGLSLGDVTLPLPVTLPLLGPNGLSCAPDALAGDIADAVLGSLGSIGGGGGAGAIDVVDNLTGDVSGVKGRSDNFEGARRRSFAPLLLPVASLPHPPLGSISGPTCSFTSCDVFYRFSSFSEPCSVYRASIRRHETDRDIELSFDQVYSSNNRAVDCMQYDTKKEFFFGHDGRQIAIYIFGSKRAFARGPRPCILHVRDSFGSPVLPQFSAPALLFAKHFEGFFCSIDLCAAAASPPRTAAPSPPVQEHVLRAAHAGAAEDVALAAEYLVGVGNHCQPGKLAVLAESNGSVASAACVNRRPDLFAAAAFDCVLFDLVRYHVMEPVPAVGHVRRSGAAKAKAWQEEKTDAEDTDVHVAGGDGNMGYEEDDEDDDDDDDDDDEDSWRRHSWYPELGCSEESAQDFDRLREVSPLHNVPGSRTSSLSGIAADTYPAVLLVARKSSCRFTFVPVQVACSCFPPVLYRYSRGRAPHALVQVHRSIAARCGHATPPQPAPAVVAQSHRRRYRGRCGVHRRSRQ